MRIEQKISVAFAILFIGIPVVVIFTGIDGIDASILLTTLTTVVICSILLYLFHGLLNLSLYRAFKEHVLRVKGKISVASLNLSKFILTIEGKTILIKIGSGRGRFIFMELPLDFDNSIRFHMYARDWYDDAADKFDGVEDSSAEKELYLIVENNITKFEISGLGNGYIMAKLNSNFPLIRSVNAKEGKIELVAMPRSKPYFISDLVDILMKIEAALVA
jgi:hypothetical protein